MSTYVFPLPARAKTPQVRWRDVSTEDTGQSRRWLAKGFNYGVDCGKSGLVVIDEDQLDEFARLATDRGETIPATYTVRTGKGRHHYFRSPGGLGNRNPLRGAGYQVDIRGDGGYVVGAGSTHPSGAGYHLVDDTDPVDLPEWLAKLLQEPQRPPERPTSGPLPTISDRYVQATVHGALTDLDALAALPEGGRDSRGHGWDSGTLAAARQLVRAANSSAGYSLETARQDFLGHAPPAVGGYSPDHKWADALKYVGQAPLTPKNDPAPHRKGGEAMTQTLSPLDMEGFDGSDGSDGSDGLASDPRPSWAPMDLTGYVNGTHKPDPPTLWTRTDGVNLAYRGKVHNIAGESESGKSMLALTIVADELKAGGKVLYLDYESDAATMMDRLLKMGCTGRQILDGLDYLNPEADPLGSSTDETAAWFRILATSYTVAVIDAITEAFAVSGVSSIDNDEVTRWGREIPKRLAARTGAAVFTLDHVTKATEGRGRYSIGAQAKMSYLTGPAFLVDVVAPMGVGMRGVLKVRVVKDRPGMVRPHGTDYRASDRSHYIATATIDSTDPERIAYYLDPPPATIGPEQARQDAHEDLMRRISEWVRDAGKPLSGKQVRDVVVGNTSNIGDALKELAERGHISMTPGPRNAVLHQHVKPYPAIPDE